MITAFTNITITSVQTTEINITVLTVATGNKEAEGFHEWEVQNDWH